MSSSLTSAVAVFVFGEDCVFLKKNSKLPGHRPLIRLATKGCGSLLLVAHDLIAEIDVTSEFSDPIYVYEAELTYGGKDLMVSIYSCFSSKTPPGLESMPLNANNIPLGEYVETCYDLFVSEMALENNGDT